MISYSPPSSSMGRGWYVLGYVLVAGFTVVSTMFFWFFGFGAWGLIVSALCGMAIGAIVYDLQMEGWWR